MTWWGWLIVIGALVVAAAEYALCKAGGGDGDHAD
jgi:hypothetical protein